MYNHKKEEIKAKLNGKEVTLYLTIDLEYDDQPVADSFDFGNEEDNKAYLARFERGELNNMMVFVKVSYAGIDGFDSLGGCHVGSKSDVDDMIESHDMIANAIEHLLVNIQETVEKLQEIA